VFLHPDPCLIRIFSGYKSQYVFRLPSIEQVLEDQPSKGCNSGVMVELWPVPFLKKLESNNDPAS
jgi:hypothetical protein